MNEIRKVKWTSDELELLRNLWISNISTSDMLLRFTNKTYTDLRSTATRKLKLLARTKYVKSCSETWTTEETDLLTKLWVTDIDNPSIYILFPDKTEKAVVAKAARLALPKRSADVRKNMLTKRNKSMGRDLSLENIILISKQYKTKSEFKKHDSSGYVSAHKLGLFDDSLSHLADGVTFNYPQTALYEITKLLFPLDEIKYNDRKTIYPKELDVFVVDKNIAFEYDGFNFHSSNEDIINDGIKNQICKNIGIDLYRIIEVDKLNPIPTILDQLKSFGFEVSGIDVNDIKSKITKYYMNNDDIKIIISNYSSLIQFKKENTRLYSFLSKNNMMSLLDNITPVPITNEIIINKVKLYNHRLDFIENEHPLYIRMMKNKAKYSLALFEYNKLPMKRSNSHAFALN